MLEAMVITSERPTALRSAVAPAAPPRPPAEARWRALGTGVHLVVTDPDALTLAHGLLTAQLNALDQVASRFRDDSEVSALARADGEAVPVSTLLLETVTAAIRAARLTDGLVDPTVGAALVRLGYDRDIDDLPATGPAVSLEVRRDYDWRDVEVDRVGHTIRVPPGTLLDLGATAKAFASDLAARLIHQATGSGVLVSLGGDIAVHGTPPAGGWAVGIGEDSAVPSADETVSVRSGGLATSSSGVRHWIRGGRRLHHIVDPLTGLPATGPWRTVTVAGGSCLDANTAATAAIVMGDPAPEWLVARRLPARLVRHDGTVVRCGGWPARYDR